MTLEEINKQIEELPSDDPEFIIYECNTRK